MFGHDNQHQNDDNTPATPLPEPQADATLGQDNPMMGAPSLGSDPVAPTDAAPEPQDTIQPTTPAPAHSDDADTLVTGDNDELLAIKQKALHELSPLVGQLEQSPEEKFRTTMMMIQASDDQTLVGTAYEAAQQIADEKVKAQALLDIVNEINYFTQQHAS